MDRISCIAYHMYHASDKQEVKSLAISLLLGDQTLRELKKMPLIGEHVTAAEKHIKHSPPTPDEVGKFIEQYMMLEV
jgi:hypothetical protein